MVVIRKSVESDRSAITGLALAAFDESEREVVAGLITDLLDDTTARPLLSLVAEADGDVVGHILFTAVTMVDYPKSVRASILAPLGVHPDFQSRGIGKALVNEGLNQLRASGVQLVFVLGHPGYYPKFGFTPAGQYGLSAPYPIPDENALAWMVLELQEGFLGAGSGTVRCADVLSRPELWIE